MKKVNMSFHRKKLKCEIKMGCLNYKEGITLFVFKFLTSGVNVLEYWKTNEVSFDGN